jgi:hypothetical protein
MKKKCKYWEDKRFSLKTLPSWNRYPVDISKKVVDAVIEKSKRGYNPAHVKYVLSLYFSLMAQEIKASEDEVIYFLDNFGSFKSMMFDKVVKLPNMKPFIKYNCKKVRFAFSRVFKQTCYKKLNINNPEVIAYVMEKRRNRSVAKIIFSKDKNLKEKYAKKQDD